MKSLLVSALVLLSAPAWTQSDDELFDPPEAGTVTAPSVVSASSDVTGRFLGTDQKTTLTGEFRASAATVWEDQDPVLNQNLSLSLGLTARPDPDVRIGAKGRWTFDPETGASEVGVQEAFADFQGADQLYFRIGKQFVSWGKGYFYSPADVLSLTRIDPADPTAAREGPTALKATWEAGPAGTYQGLVSTDRVTSGSQLRWAGLGTWLLGGVEWGLGGFYQQADEKAARVFATTSFRFLDLQVYSESVLLQKDGQPSTEQTAGFTYAKDDADRRWTLTALGQYYYNGNHHAAGSLGLSKLGGSTVSVSATALASLSEKTWTATPRLSWVASPELTVGSQFQWTSGTTGTWQGDAVVFSHLTLTVSGPLPGSEDRVDPQWKVSVSGLSF